MKWKNCPECGSKIEASGLALHRELAHGEAKEG